jgi:hypothetical protein
VHTILGGIQAVTQKKEECGYNETVNYFSGINVSYYYIQLLFDSDKNRCFDGKYQTILNNRRIALNKFYANYLQTNFNNMFQSNLTDECFKYMDELSNLCSGHIQTANAQNFNILYALNNCLEILLDFSTQKEITDGNKTNDDRKSQIIQILTILKPHLGEIGLDLGHDTMPQEMKGQIINMPLDVAFGGTDADASLYETTHEAQINNEKKVFAETAEALRLAKLATQAAADAQAAGTKAGDALYNAKETARQALVAFGVLGTALNTAVAAVTGGNQPRARYIPRPRPDNDQAYESSWSFSWLGWLALAVVMCIIIYMLYLIFKPKQKKIIIYNFRPQSGSQSGPLYVDKPKGPAYVTQ